jgi:hypothetical protein
MWCFYTDSGFPWFSCNGRYRYGQHMNQWLQNNSKDLVQMMRLLIAEYCLDKAMRLAPSDCEAGMDIEQTVVEYQKRSSIRPRHSSA